MLKLSYLVDFIYFECNFPQQNLFSLKLIPWFIVHMALSFGLSVLWQQNNVYVYYFSHLIFIFFVSVVHTILFVSAPPSISTWSFLLWKKRPSRRQGEAMRQAAKIQQVQPRVSFAAQPKRGCISQQLCRCGFIYVAFKQMEGNKIQFWDSHPVNCMAWSTLSPGMCLLWHMGTGSPSLKASTELHQSWDLSSRCLGCWE